jgi:adenosylcobinamide-GDP ribazoletransferase
LGSILTGISSRKIIIAQLIFAALIGLLAGPAGVLAYVWVLAFTEVYRQFIFRKIDGFNGDTTGAVCLIMQIVYLLLMTVLVRVL